MARITDANLAFAGQEPKFSVELTQADLMKTLSWYAQNKDRNDAFKYACDFLKKKHKLNASSIVKDKIPTFGFICRIVTNGGSLPIKEQVWLDNEIAEIKKQLDKPIVEDIDVYEKLIDLEEKYNNLLYDMVKLEEENIETSNVLYEVMNSIEAVDRRIDILAERCRINFDV